MPIGAPAQPGGASLVCFSDIRLGSVRTETVETITEEVGPERESNLGVVPQAWLRESAHGARCISRRTLRDHSSVAIRGFSLHQFLIPVTLWPLGYLL